MVEYKIIFSKQAKKDQKKLKSSKLEKKSKDLLILMIKDPFIEPPFFESLRDNLKEFYSRRINQQHRLVYAVDEKKKEIYVVRMWSHYEKL